MEGGLGNDTIIAGSGLGDDDHDGGKTSTRLFKYQ